MAVYVWLKYIKHMLKFDSMEEYNDSVGYREQLKGECNSEIIMVELNTRLWKN